MPASTLRVRVERLDTRRMAPELLRARARLMCEADARLDPAMADDPSSLAASIQSTPADVELRSYAASTEGGELAGIADSSMRPGSRAEVGVHVRPAVRRRGVGMRLLAAVAADLVAGMGDRGELEVVVDARDAAATGFLEALGWSRRGRSVTYGLRVRSERASEAEPPDGYALEDVIGRWPPDAVAAVAELRTRLPGDTTAGLASAGRAAALEERERALDELGVTRVRVLARRRHSGSVAGIHEVCWSPASSATAHVSATAVAPGDTGRGVGAALKRRGLALVAELLPSVTELRTTNDGEEREIHRLNRRIGFEEVGADETWVVVLSDLLRGPRIAAARDGAP